jgi:SAM-dependent methyltransferase
MTTNETTPPDADRASGGSFQPYRRVPQPWTGRRLSDEYLDQASCGGTSLERELGYLRAINRLLSGTSLSLRAVRTATRSNPSTRPSLLDVGTGSGDIARALAVSRGVEVDVTGLDRRAEMVAEARARTPADVAVRFVEGDVFRLVEAFGERAFDLTHASLTLHHFPDGAVVEALRSMARVSRRAVIWNDLTRGPVQLAAVRIATLAATTSTRHDARVSVEAGFTRAEIDDLAGRAGLRVAWLGRSLVYRFAAVLVPR